MIHSFMDFFRNTLIQEHPGETARWYARQYLELGHHLNDSKIPVESLTNALERQVGLGREQSIRRQKIDGVFHYYPASAECETAVDLLDGIVDCQVELSRENCKDIANLLTVNKFKNRNQAICWLMKEGIKANREYLDKVDDVVEKMREVNHVRA